MGGLNLKNTAEALMTDRTTTGASTGIIPWGHNWTFEVFGSTTSGSGSATVVIQVANTDVDTHYITMGTVTLTLGTTVTADGFASVAAWKYVRANVTSISGTGAKVTVTMATQGV